MNKKLILDEKVFTEWMNDTWNIYASQQYDGKALKLYTNYSGMFKLLYGAKTLYYGNNMSDVIEAWDKV